MEVVYLLWIVINYIVGNGDLIRYVKGCERVLENMCLGNVIFVGILMFFYWYCLDMGILIV